MPRRKGFYKNVHHGMSRTPTYRSWANMLHRCHNPNVPSYQHYGAKGIKVCKRWLLFKNFLADMGKRPKGTSIARLHHDRDYKPSNSRWRKQNHKRGW